MDPVLVWIAAIVLAGLFVTAGGHKFVAPSYYHELIAGYIRMPAEVAVFVRIVLVVSELGLGLLLLMPAARPAAAWAALVLLLVYSLLISVSLMRGLDMDCGCSGPYVSPKLSPWLLLRNTVLIMFAWLLTLPSSNRLTGYEDVLIILSSCAVLFLIYLSFEQLLVNRDKLASMRSN